MAHRLITEKGESVTMTQLTNGAPVDPATPWKPTAATSVAHSVDIAFVPMRRIGKRSDEYMPSTVVPKGNVKGIMGAVDFEPALKDTITRTSGQVLTVVAIESIDPNGEGAIVHTMELAS